MKRIKELAKNRLNKTGVINDPLGLTHNPSSSDHYSRLKIVLFWMNLKSGDVRTDFQTPRAKIVITTGSDYGWAEWIKSYQNLPATRA